MALVFIVEDDNDIRQIEAYALKCGGFEIEEFEDAKALYERLEKKTPDLFLLDVMLPEEDGLEVLKKLRNRSETRKLPVIMLTAKDSEYDKVIGLDSGADDYVAKPFGMMELISRIKALLRRTESDTKKDEYTAGGLYVCPSKHIVRANGKDVVLTYKEFELLCLLISNRGTVFTRDQILRNIWGFEFDGENRTVDVHVRTLRTKLGECGQLIETVRGIGYKIGD